MKKKTPSKKDSQVSIQFLGSAIPSPLRFSSPLPFSPLDKLKMPWLVQPTRTYRVLREVGKGGRATAYRGIVVNEDGSEWKDAEEIVIKIPNVTLDSPYTLGQIRDYLERQNRESGSEWQLTRERLRGCIYANPIIDFTTAQVIAHDEIFQVPFTAQFYLTDAEPLDEYLLRIKQRTKAYLSEQGKPVDNWSGMRGAANWMDLTRAIAVALADIHQRRVVHGDIWPPNIFMRQCRDDGIVPVFIDFGEAFPLEPKGEPRRQRDHAYRAPERADGQSIVTQQADVYSFGKLLLHLAVGAEPILDATIRGHRRRDNVRNLIRKRNQTLVNDNPFIMDLICNCITVDPVDRPSMDDVVRALDTYVDFGRKRKVLLGGFAERARSVTDAWKQFQKTSSANDELVDPFLEGLLGQKLEELERMIGTLNNDVVILRDTRERLMLAMVSLFLRLEAGDRFMSVTSPRMWQGSALGLDGRYFTATKLATRQGATIQRIFVVSVQELGMAWALKWSRNLGKMKDKRARLLRNMVDAGIRDYNVALKTALPCEMSKELRGEAQLRLQLVLRSYANAFDELGAERFQKDSFQSFNDGHGIYLGLLMEGTMESVKITKASHPVSVFYFGKERPQNRYLLLMTDCHGRNTPGVSLEDGPNQVAAIEAKPELRGITVFKSVLGIPEDRIKRMESPFRLSVNIGSWIHELVDALPDLDS